LIAASDAKSARYIHVMISKQKKKEARALPSTVQHDRFLKSISTVIAGCE